MDTSLITRTPDSAEVLSAKETSEILSFVTGNVMEINTLSEKVVAAQKAADDAKNKIDGVMRSAKEAQKKASGRTEVHWYNSKAQAINDVQSDVSTLAKSQVKIAESQITLAEVQQRAAEAQTQSFEFQKQLANATATMIKFSTASIATSRLVVRELEARMNGASKEELSELAKKELEAVVYQIKAQQDIMSRQDQLTDIVRELDDRITIQCEADRIRDDAIESQMKKGVQRDLRISDHDRSLKAHHRILISHQQKDEEQDKLLAVGAAKDEEQDARLCNIDEINAQQDALIAQGAAKDKEQDDRLSNIDEINAQQDALIAQGAAKDKEQDDRLSNIDEINAQQDALIAQSAAKDKEQDDRLSDIDEINAQQDALIAQGAAKDKEQDARLSDIDEINAQQDALIAQVVAKDKEQDIRLCDIDTVNAQQDIRLNIIDQINTQQDTLIAETMDKNREQDDRLCTLEQISSQHNELLEKQAAMIDDLTQQIGFLKKDKGSKVVLYITAATSAIAMILSILRFFI